MELRVRNSGTVVDELQFEVVGAAAPWAVVEPPSVSLFPQGEATVQVRFQPPRSPAPPAGPMPFAVAVTCREDAMGGVAEEGTIEVLPVASVTLELLPSVNRGRRGATYQIAVDNRGNTPVESTIAFVDTTEQLTGSVAVPVVRSDPGWASFTELKVKPRKRFWKGAAQSKPFQVTLDTHGGEFTTVDGTFLQESLLPKWLGKAVLALAALALVLAALWFLAMKPFVESAAEDAAKKEAAAATQTANEAKQAAESAAKAAEKAAEGGAPTPAPPSVPTPTGAPVAPTTKQDVRLTAASEDSKVFVVPGGKTFSVTDVVFSNPKGDQGTLTLYRGDVVWFQLNLANFRDSHDLHFATPIVVGSGQQLRLEANCSAGSCTDESIFIAGELG